MRGLPAATAVLSAALAVALLGGCAGGTGDPGDPGSPSPPGGSPSAEPTATPRPPMPTVSPPASRAQTLTGEVIEGVEAGCVLLRTKDQDYLLVGGEDEVQIGRTATVRGYARPDLATICQQGTPFVVLEVIAP